MRRKIFFVSYGGGHVTIADPICRRLLEEDKVNVKLLALTGAYQQVVSKYPGGVVTKISDYVSIFDSHIDKIVGYGLSILGENFNSSLGLSKFDSIVYLGLSYNDLVDSIGADEAKNQYLAKKRQSFEPVESAKQILKYENPDLVVTTTSPRFEIAFTKAALEMGIETIQISDLFGENHTLPKAKHVVTMNESISSEIKKRDPKEVKRFYHSLGQPVFDQTLDEVNAVDQTRVKDQLKLDKEKLVLLFSPVRNANIDKNGSIVGEGNLDEICVPVFNILDGIIRDKNVAVIVRPHPNDPIGLYKRFFEGKSGYHYFDDNSLNLFEAIAISDAVLSYNSTIVLQAQICSKQAFTYNKNENQPYLVDAFTKPPFIYSRNFEKLSKSLLRIGEPLLVNRSEKFYEYGAVSKIVNLIYEIA